MARRVATNVKLARRKARSRLAAEARNAERAAQLIMVKARLIGVIRAPGTVPVMRGALYYDDGTTARFEMQYDAFSFSR